jgi:hypothetical protein
MRQPRPRRRGRTFNTVVKAFVWVVLIIFVLTSVGVALVTTTSR